MCNIGDWNRSQEDEDATPCVGATEDSSRPTDQMKHAPRGAAQTVIASLPPRLRFVSIRITWCFAHSFSRREGALKPPSISLASPFPPLFVSAPAARRPPPPPPPATTLP